MKRMLIMTFLIFLVYTGISQDNKKNSISLGFGSVVSTKIESFSPVMDVCYRRDFNNGLGINLGYRYKDCNYDEVCFLVYDDNGDISNVRSNKPNLLNKSFIAGLTYNLKIYKDWFIVPMFNIGVGYGVVKNTVTHSWDNSVHTHSLGNGTDISVIPSVNIEYHFDRIRLFCSYSYEMLFEIDRGRFYMPNIDVDWYTILGDYYFVGDLKLGVAFKF